MEGVELDDGPRLVEYGLGKAVISFGVILTTGNRPTPTTDPLDASANVEPVYCSYSARWRPGQCPAIRSTPSQFTTKVILVSNSA